jgi:hypothetical protein
VAAGRLMQPGVGWRPVVYKYHILYAAAWDTFIVGGRGRKFDLFHIHGTSKIMVDWLIRVDFFL